jgi:hypothetical protein
MSKRFWLDTEDWKKIGKGALLALAPAVVVFLGDLTSMVDFGASAPIIAAIASIGINFLRKWITDNTKP